MNGWRWLIVLGLSLVLAGPSRADVDLSGVYLLRPEHPARYRVTQTGTDVEISSDVDFGAWKRGEVLFKAKLAQGAGSSGRLVGAYKRDGAWVQAVLRFQVGATYRNFSIVTDVGGKLLDTVHSYDAGPKPPTLEFVDEQGKPTDPVAGFSQPAPTVKLDPVTRASLQVAGGVARFKLSGTVRSDLAEIVAGGRANITKVTIEYFSAPPDSKLVTVSVPVTVQAAAPPSGSRRPFAFSGRFSAQVAVPLADMGTHVAVRATDLTGGSGYDTITIRVRSQSWTSQLVNGTEVFRPAPPSAADVTEVVEGESTDPGAFHPVWIRIADPSAQPRTELEVGAQRVKVVKRDGERYAELPFIAVAGDPPGGLVNVVAAGKPLVVRYGQLEHKLGWATTPHSPPRIHAYPAGTEVNHVVEWDGFDAWEIQDVVPLRKEPRGPGFAWIADRDNVTVVERAVTSKRTARVRLRLGKHAWQVRDKGLQFFLRSRATPSVIRAPTIGAYKVVPLRTVIVGVDGLGESYALEGATFRRLFGGGGGAVRETALAALPTITWCNWAGIMTGAPPARHGVLGNSFFSRDKATQARIWPRRPTNSDTRTTFLSLTQSLSAVVSGLDEQVIGGVGSIYDAIAMATRPQRFPIRVHSINMWYRRSQDGRVTVDEGRFPLVLRSLPHSPEAARLLDGYSGDDAEAHYRTHRDSVDVMTVYFPGPDNIAHDVGDRALPRNQPLYRDYTSGPALPNVLEGLRSIGQHAAKHTDAQLARLVAAIDEAGYLHATVFVLVADHGLHAYRKDDAHVVRARKARGLRDLFDAMGLSLWTGGIPGPPALFASVDNHELVYAPNGGLAHLYVRRSADAANPRASKPSWQDRPRPGDVARVARQLYIEASGGGTGVPGRQLPACAGNDLRTHKACFANLTLLGRPQPWSADRQGALGSPPAIFVRMPGAPTTSYRWLRGIDPAPRTDAQLAEGADLQWGTIAELLRHRTRGWPAFEARLEEMNHAQRTGEIVMIMNGPEGYLAVNEGDELDGWHGGPEISESLVPLYFNIPGDVVDEAFLGEAVRAVKRTRPAMDQQLRNWHMGPVLAEIYGRLYR